MKPQQLEGDLVLFKTVYVKAAATVGGLITFVAVTGAGKKW